MTNDPQQGPAIPPPTADQRFDSWCRVRASDLERLREIVGLIQAERDKAQGNKGGDEAENPESPSMVWRDRALAAEAKLAQLHAAGAANRDPR